MTSKKINGLKCLYFEMELFATFELQVLLLAEQAFTEARIEHLSVEGNFVRRGQAHFPLW